MAKENAPKASLVDLNYHEDRSYPTSRAFFMTLRLLFLDALEQAHDLVPAYEQGDDARSEED